MRKIVMIVLLSFLASACQPSTPTPELPTQVQFPTETNTPQATDTATVTHTPEPSATATDTPTETFTPSNTPTPTITLTPSATPNMTLEFVGTSTAFVQEVPSFSTLTPLPAGAIGLVARPTSTGTPEVLADVVITRLQFQEEVDLLLPEHPGISRARVSFIAEQGIMLELTADDNGVFVTGEVNIPFNITEDSFNNFIIFGAFTVTMPNDAEPSEAFLGRAVESIDIVRQAFDNILNQRLGEGNHNLESFIIQENAILVSLLVPEP